MGSNVVRRRDGPSPQRARAYRVDRSGVGGVGTLSGSYRSRRAPECQETAWVVAEVDESAASNGVPRRAVEEARLREAPLRVLTSWQSRFTDVHDTHAVPDGNRLAKARLDHQVAQWRKRYPDLDVETMAVHGTTLKHLTDKADSIQLLVVGHERARGIRDLIGPPGYALAARNRLFCLDLRTAERIVSTRSAASTERVSHGESLSRR